ncbi:MAG: flagellar assembly protein FliW, partial [Desulfovibrio sp.]|nr:flagellar assembly protein FliW [Desulfovibrio sp.]
MEQELKTIEIDTRLGKRCIDTSKIIVFPRGLIGFEEEHRFVLLQIKPNAPLLVLQSVKNPQLGLLVTDPKYFLDDYNPTLNEGERHLLQIMDDKDMAILVTVSIPQGEPSKAMLNLTGPIIVNYHSCVGLQVPQNEMAGPSRINLCSLA